MSEGRSLSDISATRSVRLGWWLSSEEHDPRDLVQQCVAAEAAGFETAMISDHLQPWVSHQGHAAHVWTVLGALLNATDAMQIGAGVTAMVERSHPVNVAHASATCAVLSGDRVFVGVGAGERLNEQAFGGRWPSVGERRARLEEAIGILRDLWAGKLVSRRGDHFAVEHLQLWTRPATPPPLFVAASGVRSAELAGRVGDGLIAVTPDRRIVEVFRGSGGEGKPCIGQLHISLAATMESAVEQAWEWWPHGVVPPALLSELARPTDFEVTAQAIGRDRIGDTVVCATDAEPIHAAIARFAGAGFDTVYLHQVGPDQDRLVRLARDELLTERQAGTRNGSSGRVRVKSAISAAWSDGRSIPRSM